MLYYIKNESSWINNLGSILTVEEAADWVMHAVQLPEDVAEAFRSNSVSGYDFPELVADNGAGLYYDLGIKRSYRKRIVKVCMLFVIWTSGVVCFFSRLWLDDARKDELRAFSFLW